MLEQVLEKRKEQEEQALLEQVKAQQECQYCREQLEDTSQKLAQVMDFSSLRPDEQLHSLMYREHLKAKLQKQTRLLQRAEEILQLRIDSTVKAMRERMMLEKLKEKQLNNHLQIENYLEQRELDELSILGFVRQQRDAL